MICWILKKFPATFLKFWPIVSYMVGKLMMWAILCHNTSLFLYYNLRYRFLLSLWDSYDLYSLHLVACISTSTYYSAQLGLCRIICSLKQPFKIALLNVLIDVTPSKNCHPKISDYQLKLSEKRPPAASYSLSPDVSTKYYEKGRLYQYSFLAPVEK